MAETHDRNPLNGSETWLEGIAYLVLILFPVILFIVGGWNLYLAIEMGNRVDQSLFDLFESWREGLDITKFYSQSNLIAARRFSNAVWQVSAAVITAGAALALTWSKRGKKEVGKSANKTAV